jgi:hypothetical protein
MLSLRLGGSLAAWVGPPFGHGKSAQGRPKKCLWKLRAAGGYEWRFRSILVVVSRTPKRGDFRF